MGFLSNAANKAAKDGKIDSATVSKISTIDSKTQQKVQQQIDQKIQGAALQIASTHSQMEKYQGESSGPCGGCSGGLCPGCGGFSEKQVKEFIEFTNENPEVQFGRAQTRVDLKFGKDIEEEEKRRERESRAITQVVEPPITKVKSGVEGERSETGPKISSPIIDEEQKRRIENENIERLFLGMKRKITQMPNVLGTHTIVEETSGNQSKTEKSAKPQNKEIVRPQITHKMNYLFEPKNMQQAKEVSIQLKYVKNNLVDSLELVKRGKIDYEKYHNIIHALNMIEKTIEKIENSKIKFGAKKALGAIKDAFAKLKREIEKLKKKKLEERMEKKKRDTNKERDKIKDGKKTEKKKNETREDVKRLEKKKEDEKNLEKQRGEKRTDEKLEKQTENKKIAEKKELVDAKKKKEEKKIVKEIVEKQKKPAKELTHYKKEKKPQKKKRRDENKKIVRVAPKNKKKDKKRRRAA